MCGVQKMSVIAETQTDQGWCERLYEAKAAGLILYGRALGLSHSEAEDVVHELFAALLELGSTPDEPEHYAMRAFRNRALNYKRSLWRRVAREFESIRWFEREAGETPIEREAMRCLETLPRDQREVIVLKIWSNYTFESIGRLLEISPNTAAGRYRYGIQKMREALKDTEYERFGMDRESSARLEAAPAFA
jgi:RNA polymerase sigma-70 factor, ECF subfamily